MEQPPLSAVNHERRQKPPVFPPCSGLGATANTLSHTLIHLHAIRCGAGMKEEASEGGKKDRLVRRKYL